MHALAVYLDTTQMVAYLYPVQICLFREHKNTEEQFFANWSHWSRWLGNFKIMVRFIRIVPQGRRHKTEKFPAPQDANYETNPCCPAPKVPNDEVIHVPLAADSNAWKTYREARKRLEIARRFPGAKQ
jgi:hypothetical protein